MNTLKVVTRLTLIWLSLIPLAQAASFDCKSAESKVEKIVCDDPEISKLDEDLNTVYTDSLHGEGQSELIRSTQKQWIKTRNDCFDQNCVKDAYHSRIEFLRSNQANKVETPNLVLLTNSVGPLKLVTQFDNYRPQTDSVRFLGDQLYFSQYDQSGNNLDVIALNVESKYADYILRGRPGAKFVAMNSKYLVINEQSGITRPLVVIDRKSEQTLKKLKLQLGISWAMISGKKLIAIQGDSLSAGYQTNVSALIFDLPSLKILKSTSIIGGNGIALWKDKIISVGNQLGIYDYNFKELAKVDIPYKQINSGVSCAANGPISVSGNRAAIAANCGDILIYDLSTLKIERTIPSYSMFYSMATIDNLLFTAPTQYEIKLNQAHVFDIETGKELAIVPISGSYLYAQGNTLISNTYQFGKPLITIYGVDTKAIRSGKGRVEKLVSVCTQARSFAENGDIYRAIQLCESAGMVGVIRNGETSVQLKPFIRDYGIWLSKTMSRYDESIPILESINSKNLDIEVMKQLTEAKLKVRILDKNGDTKLTLQEQQTDFGKAIDHPIPKGRERDIFFGSFSNLFHFADDRIYVGSWSCADSSNGVSLIVYDRQSLESVGSVQVASCDDEYQDSISSITSDKSNVYLALAYRYEQAGRTNFVAVNKKNLNVLKESFVDKQGDTLIYYNGELLSCDCSGISGSTCSMLNTKTLIKSDRKNYAVSQMVLKKKIQLLTQVIGQIMKLQTITFQKIGVCHLLAGILKLFLKTVRSLKKLTWGMSHLILACFIQ